MPHDFQSLTSSQLETMDRATTVFFFPIGPIESHGPHLPLGMDLIEASRLCQLSATRLETEMPDWKGLIMPPLPLGIDSNTNQVRITVRPYVLRDFLVDSCKSLMKLGFIHFVCFSGHLGPRQLTAIEEAGILIRRIHFMKNWGHRMTGRKQKVPTLISASSAQVSSKQVWKAPIWNNPDEHAGRRDTSVGLYLAPEQVDPMFAGLPPATDQYWGNPAAATSARGQETLEDTLQTVFPKLRAVWEGAPASVLFRTHYRLFPPNRSFFRAWLLSGVLLLMALAWVFVTLNAMKEGLSAGY